MLFAAGPVHRASPRPKPPPRMELLPPRPVHLYALVHQPQRLPCLPQKVVVLRQVEPRPEQRLRGVVVVGLVAAPCVLQSVRRGRAGR